MIDKNQIYVIAGMPRAATTFLYHTLQKHPKIFVPSRKETDFFSVNYYRGMNWYLNFFKDMEQGHIGFDISPMYFLDSDAHERIKEFCSDIKVVLIIRKPVEWIISFYKHMQAKSIRKLEFRRFIQEYVYKKDGQDMVINILDNSIEKQISIYRKLFSSNLLLCNYDIFNTSPLSLMQMIEKFSSLPPFFNDKNFDNVIMNASDREPSKLINILMQKKLFADLVVKLIPKRLILSVRYKIQSSRTPSKTGRKDPDIKKEDMDYIKNRYDSDEYYISKLFSQSAFILGNGVLFEKSS